MLVSYCYEVHLIFFYENMAFTPTVKWAVWGEPLGVQLRREIYMCLNNISAVPDFLTDHSRFEQSRNEKCKLEV